MKVFVGMETSGVVRRAFQDKGHEVISCDLLPADDGAVSQILGLDEIRPMNCHIVGDVFDALETLRPDWWPDLAIFHPDCTFHAVSAAWAFGDGPYHQKVKPETLVGAARRAGRDRAEEEVRRIVALPIGRKVIENPIGTLSTRVLGKPTQVIQPNWFGANASKATCLWLYGLPRLRPTQMVPGRTVEWPSGSGKMVERWSNQTDSGQNRLSPGADRWQKRAETYPGIGAAFAEQWG